MVELIGIDTQHLILLFVFVVGIGLLYYTYDRHATKFLDAHAKTHEGIETIVQSLRANQEMQRDNALMIAQILLTPSAEHAKLRERLPLPEAFRR